MAAETQGGGQLPRPVVPPGEYDEEYYRTCCGGYEEWTAREGRQVHGIYLGSLERAGLTDGEVVVDLGTGRAELPAVAVTKGAAYAVGLEYSIDALRLSRQTFSAQEVEGRTSALAADVRAAPLRTGCADLVTMLDIVEHLAPGELLAALREAFRLLRPGGRVFIHTMPTSTPYDVTYRVQRWVRPTRLRRWPANPRIPIELSMHVNEQTCRRLRRSLRDAGFPDPEVELGEWVRSEFVPDERARRVYARFARWRLTRPLSVCNVFATARRPDG